MQADEAYVNKHHRITDNVFYDYGKRVGHGSAVWVFQSGDTKILHNLMQEGPRDSVGVYSCRFGAGKEAGMNSAYNKTLDFWSSLDVLTTRNIEVACKDADSTGCTGHPPIHPSNPAAPACIVRLELRPRRE